MADEIRVQVGLTVENGNLKETISTSSTFDQAAIGGPTPGYVTIGTTEEQVTFGELGTLGWLYMRNLDATNYVQWGPATTVYQGRMEAGEPVLFRLEPGSSVFLKANTAACKVLIKAFED